MIIRWGTICLLMVSVFVLRAEASLPNNPTVIMETNLGDVIIELYIDDAPITVENFLSYVNADFYDGSVIHRVDNNQDFSIIQGGMWAYYAEEGYVYELAAGGMIVNESDNGLSNLRGTIAMARTSAPHSASSQFFVNQVDNILFDRANYPDGYGYCVFGDVIRGMSVVDVIANMETIVILDEYGDPIASLTQFPYPPVVEIYRAQLWPDSSDNTNDGRINLADFAKLSSQWLSEPCNKSNGYCDGADLDYSGAVGAPDVAVFAENWLVRIGAEPSASNFDGDTKVELDDLAVIMANWLAVGCDMENGYCDGADLNHSGNVDMSDFSLFSANWQVTIE